MARQEQSESMEPRTCFGGFGEVQTRGPVKRLQMKLLVDELIDFAVASEAGIVVIVATVLGSKLKRAISKGDLQPFYCISVTH